MSTADANAGTDAAMPRPNRFDDNALFMEMKGSEAAVEKAIENAKQIWRNAGLEVGDHNLPQLSWPVPWISGWFPLFQGVKRPASVFDETETVPRMLGIYPVLFCLVLRARQNDLVKITLVDGQGTLLPEKLDENSEFLTSFSGLSRSELRDLLENIQLVGKRVRWNEIAVGDLETF